MPLPSGTTVYAKRPLPSKADELPAFLGRELGNVERALKDVVVRSTRTVTAATTVTLDDSLVCADATSAAFAVTLPTARIASGRTFQIKRINAGANAVTVTAAGTNTIDGSATYSLAVQYQSVTVQSDGATWWIV